MAAVHARCRPGTSAADRIREGIAMPSAVPAASPSALRNTALAVTGLPSPIQVVMAAALASVEQRRACATSTAEGR
jgi:hypothetical protein